MYLKPVQNTWTTRFTANFSANIWWPLRQCNDIIKGPGAGVGKCQQRILNPSNAILLKWIWNKVQSKNWREFVVGILVSLIEASIRESKGEIDKLIIIVENVPVLITNRTSRPKISKAIADLNNIINQLDLTYFLTLYQMRGEYVFFSDACETSSRLGHMLGPKDKSQM